ncbi:MFS transporter [Microvirga flavescens]|uniref:MFS transporter n=1 Tax=Microvirga flavescens TaxID=2249811 RepID=UPI000DD5D199|nr:MFS transporter [Microvirga flavescens]
MSNAKALGPRLAALHTAAFLSHGFYLPFFPVWLQSKALDPTMIGLIVSVPIIIRVFVIAPLLSLSDRGVGTRLLLITFYIGQIVGFPLLWLSDNGLVIMAIVAAVSIAQAAVIPANDLVTTIEVQKHPGLNYGRIRGAGSIAFLFASILAGYLVGLFGANVVVWALTLIPVLGIAVVLLALPPDVARRQAGRELAAVPQAPRNLSAVLWLAMIGGALIQSSHGALNAFGSIYWRSAGFSDATIGYFWAVGVLAEIAVFLVLGRLVGRGNAGIVLLLVGGLAAIVRFTSLSLHPGLISSLMLQTLHGLTFAAAHLGIMACFAAFAPAAARGRAQGIYGSITALATVLSTVASGEVYRVAGSMVFAAMVPLAFVGLVLAAIALRVEKAQPQSAGSGG